MTNRKISILLVEDSVADARYMQQLLPATRYVLTHVTSMAAARQEFASNQMRFDVIVLDLSLPDVSGLNTFTSVLDWAPATAILIVTGLEDEEIALRAVTLGAQDYILKREITEYSLSRQLAYAIERKQAELESKRLAILEQREEFMATLTHDLKNPLIGANRILELMAESALGTVSEEQSKLLLQLRDSNKLLLSMIQNLLDVYRFEKDVNAVSLQNIDLLKVVTSCLNDIAPIAQNRDIKLTTELPKQVREIFADASALRRVVQNLLDNALKFTPRGGEISLAVQPTNGDIVVKVGDTGPGIPPDELSRLFLRFSQGRIGKKYTPGTGLGLYLCKQIVEAHHGMISCASTVGRGTTFEVRLPAT